jgi:acyl carrier protein
MPPPSPSDLEQQIKELLVQRLDSGVAAADIRGDTPLIDELGLDSAGIFTMVTALEEHFDIELDDDELTPDTFASVASVAAVVRAKVG